MGIVHTHNGEMCLVETMLLLCSGLIGFSLIFSLKIILSRGTGKERNPCGERGTPESLNFVEKMNAGQRES